MGKKFLHLFASVVTAVALTVAANAAFAKPNTYTEGQFKDVQSNAWFAKEVSSAYELGFMNGTATDVFSPEGNVTVAQGITMASRVNASYNGKEIASTQGGNWYDAYVKYAIDNGIMKDGQFDSYTRNITRAEMATLFADAIPASEYTAINSVEHIPDVIESNDYAKKILLLYNAGIVVGSDDYGTFNPDSDIKRSESAAIINRVALPENRVKKTLKEYNFRDPYFLLDFNGTVANGLSNVESTLRENINSGWKVDNRGGAPRTSIEQPVPSVISIGKNQPTALIREFNKIDKDIITAEFQVTQSVEKGGFVKFCDFDGKDAFVYAIIDGSWAVLGKDGKYTTIAKSNIGKVENFKVYLDIPGGKVKTYIENVLCGEHEMLSDNIASIHFLIDETGKGIITPGKMTFTANYAVFENFTTYGMEEVYGWKKEGTPEIKDEELVLKGKSTVTKPFYAPVDTKYIAEMQTIFPEGENAGFKVLSGTATAIQLASKDGKLYANGKVVYEKLTRNMWYRLRVEANPSTGKADIVINGRTLATVALNTTKPVDSLVIFSENGNAKIDDIKVYRNVDHYDYAPAPVAKANLDDYILAMNVCNIWNNNRHFGWACITPYDENKPVLGYYDEENRETADWEIKYMVEGGIDVQAICWYAYTSDGPIKIKNNNSHLADGIQHAKYQDYMKYCIIWEAGSGTGFNSKQFREHVVPYWFENYFLDENYAVIDNKLLLDVFSFEQLSTKKYFGSIAKTKEEFDYLEEVARSYGFDGFIFVSDGYTSTIEAVGTDAFAAYHWDKIGNKYEVNTQKNTQRASETKTSYAIPTISVGFTNYGWHDIRYPIMTPEDWDKSHEWVKNTYIPKYAKKDTWQEKMVWISTWNEYGEGTYIMPCEGLYGFAYLDTLRDKYTDMPKDLPAVIPNEAQLERINHLYPQHARLLRNQSSYVDPLSATANKKEYETVKTIVPSEGFAKEINRIGDITYSNGIMTGISTGDDFNFLVDGVSGLDLTGIAGINLEIKIPKDKGVQVFFDTAEEPGLSEAKSVTAYSNGEMQTMFINFADKCGAAWSGTLKTLRIDPASGTNIEFKIGKIEFVKVKEVVIDTKYAFENKLFVNGIEISGDIHPEKAGNTVVYPFDPETAVDHILYTFMDWDHDARVLTLTGNNHTVSFKDGSDRYTVDGVEKKLGYTLYSVDGIPMIDFKVLANALGYTFKQDGTNAYVETPEIEMFNNYNKEANWMFSNYTSDGWKPSANSKFIFNSGDYITIDFSTGTNKDFHMLAGSKLNFPAKKYKAIELKVRYKYESDHPHGSVFYFTTSLDSTWNESKTFVNYLRSADSNGEWETYTIDLTSNTKWLGDVTGLRFDPFNAYGYMDIEYIKFIEDPDYVPEAKITGIINGDAETPGVIFFTGATVTIEEDETKPGNHVYRFTGPKSKSWTYAKHAYPFETGKKYRIAFDVRGLGDTAGNKPKMEFCVNIQYPDANGSTAHIAKGLWLESNAVWQHIEFTYSPGTIAGTGQTSFSCYVSPPGDNVSGIYELDNVVVEEIK